MDMAVADDAWASLVPDLLLQIFCRLETTAVIRCAGACKPWRRAIIGNASSLRPRPDRFNPNLLLGFFHYRWHGTLLASVVTVTSVDTGRWQRLSTLVPAESAGGVDLSMSRRILSSRDGLLLLQIRRTGSNHDELCLCNAMFRDCRFLPLPSIMDECEYTIFTGCDLALPGSSTRDDHGAVWILAKAGKHVLCSKEDRDRLTYQVFFCRGDGAGIWGRVQRSEVLNKNKGLLMPTYGRNAAVVGYATVHWLARTQLSRRVTCTVGLDIYTGRAWVTELPIQCQFIDSSTAPCALTTSGNGRLSLVQPLEDHHLKVWVLNDGMDWTVQQTIHINTPNYWGDKSLYSNVVCPRSGYMFVVSSSSLQRRINLDSRACNPVQPLSKRGKYHYYPYEMDWSTYISKMKNFVSNRATATASLGGSMVDVAQANNHGDIAPPRREP